MLKEAREKRAKKIGPIRGRQKIKLVKIEWVLNLLGKRVSASDE